nr:Cas9 endonuclease PAM-interacting domain-containing protein [Companilactobacillus keshanensis]
MRLAYGEYSKFFEDIKKQARNRNGKVPGYSQNGFIIGSMFNGKTQVNKDNGEIIWDQKIKDSISNIFKYKQFNITKPTRIYDGALFNQTIQTPDKNKLIPLKQDLDPHIYGGYTSDKPSYSVLVDIDGKKKLVSIPTRIDHEISIGKVELVKWISDNTKHKKEIQILIEKVPLGQLTYSQDKGYLSSPSATEMVNARQLLLPFEEVALLSLLDKSSTDNYRFILSQYEPDYLANIYSHIIAKMKEFYPFYKSEAIRLEDNIDAFKSLDNEKQLNVISQVLNLLHANSTSANLKFGKISTSSFGRKPNGYEFSNTDFIYESPTGLYRSIIHIE